MKRMEFFTEAHPIFVFEKGGQKGVVDGQQVSTLVGTEGQRMLLD